MLTPALFGAAHLRGTVAWDRKRLNPEKGKRDYQQILQDDFLC